MTKCVNFKKGYWYYTCLGGTATDMKYFQQIPKDWKEQGAVIRDAHTRETIDKKSDYFTVRAHWKIKDDADTFHFATLENLVAWAKEDALVDPEQEKKQK